MTKVVYNACYGGFSLSRKAALWLAERGQKEIIAEIARREEWAKNDKSFGAGGWADSSWGRDIDRADPLLVECVEALGDEADGGCACLAIEDIPPGTLYRIDEYDGNESVATQDSYEWKRA
jgi:hypothetical protein